jgi:hypothetical protein
MGKESAQAALGKFAEAVNTGKFDLFDQVVVVGSYMFLSRIVRSGCIPLDEKSAEVPLGYFK